jgi:alkanesulfonate monooxygenase
MSIEFVGTLHTREFSETHPATRPVLDRDYVELLAKAHEYAGFDWVLVPLHTTMPDSTMIAAFAASVTHSLRFLIAHRPGTTFPTLAARQLATLDELYDGRMGVHVITGGDEAEMRQDGDFLPKDERYARTGEYIEVIRRLWTEQEPFDFAGKHFRFESGQSLVKPYRRRSMPIFFAGASEAAVSIAARYADVYALWGETQANVRKTVATMRAAATAHARQIRFSLSFRPVLADTEEKAWARADEILQRARAIAEPAGRTNAALAQNVGSRRLRDLAAQGERLDKRLWTAMAALTGGRGNSTALVGTPEQVAETLLEYYQLGVSVFFFRGFDPLEDAVDYGRSLLPLTRRLVTERLAGLAPVAL